MQGTATYNLFTWSCHFRIMPL